jgi:hypothetical protein
MKVIYTDQSIDSLKESLSFIIEQLELPPEKATLIKERLFDRAHSLSLNPNKGQLEEYFQDLKKPSKNH